MATIRPFAYNPGWPSYPPISGTDQIHNLAIGTTSKDYSKNPGGVKWWNGPDEDLGYVIAYAQSSGKHPTHILNPGPDAQMIWSQTRKAVDIALSNSYMTASQVFSYSQSVLSDTFIGQGHKIMFTIHFNSTQPSVGIGGRVIGIGTDSMNYKGAFDAYPGNDSRSIGFADDGKFYFSGTAQSIGLPTWTSEDVIDIAIDNAAGLIWIRVNGGNWNNNSSNNPETGAGGIGMHGLNSLTTYPAVSPYIYGSMEIFSNAPYGSPSGFTVLGTNLTSSVGFKRSLAKTESSFIELANREYEQSFTTGNDAKTWLNDNGYWTSWGI